MNTIFGALSPFSSLQQSLADMSFVFEFYEYNSTHLRSVEIQFAFLPVWGVDYLCRSPATNSV